MHTDLRFGKLYGIYPILKDNGEFLMHTQNRSFVHIYSLSYRPVGVEFMVKYQCKPEIQMLENQSYRDYKIWLRVVPQTSPSLNPWKL